ncbi:hypothetical protein [Legionella impletisoli]|nr:hypothetical protein [Legionella impletisoli]
MLLSRLQKFSHELTLIPDKTARDVDLLQDIHTFLENLPVELRSKEEDLSPEQTLAIEEFVLKLFAERWERIKDTAEDYTLSNSTVNQLWITYAQELEDLPNRTYLQILFPNVTNRKDPNTLALLHECRNPQSLYLAQDGVTLCQVSGLFSRIIMGKSLSTYRQNKLSKVYPLSINELRRLRAKPDHSFSAQHAGYEYTKFWSYLENLVFRTWENKGRPPRMAVVELYELLQYFFQSSPRNQIEFHKRIFALNEMLEGEPVDDVNSFFGQVIEVEGRSCFLIDVLLGCLEQDLSSLHSKLHGIVKWISQYDASFILNSRSLRPLYESLHLGAGFTVNDLIEALQNLSEAESEYKDDLVQIILKLEATKSFEKYIIEEIEALYKKRWLTIMGKELDYTRTQVGLNALWIRLAQLLSGADLVSKNYYTLLMPTLKSEIDPIELQSTVNFSLDDTLLSEDGQMLIYLPYCLRQLESQGTFYVPSMGLNSPPHPLTEIEKERLKSNGKYRRYLKTYEQDEIEPLSIPTLLAIWNLVNHSLYPVGLIYAKNYSVAQLTAAEEAFDEFREYFEALTHEEKEQITKHTIIYYGQKRTFGDVLDQVYKGECVALCCRWFMQLVVDYFPWLKFRRDIEENRIVQLDEIRHAAQRKIINKNKSNELIRHLQKIYCSLLSRRFSEKTHRISGFNYENDVPEIGEKLFNLLAPFFVAEKFDSVHEVYIEVIKQVNASLFDGTNHPSDDTKRWLKSIMTGELFRVTSWLNPQAMLNVFPVLMPNNSPAHDAVIKAMISKSHPFIREICFNLFCLSTLTDKAMRQLKHALDTSSISLDEDYLLLCLSDLIARRLSQEGSKSSTLGFEFHRRRPMVKKDWERTILQGFKSLPETVLSIADLLQHAENTLIRLRIPLTLNLQKYWFSLTSRRLPPPGFSHTSDVTGPTLSS